MQKPPNNIISSYKIILLEVLIEIFLLSLAFRTHQFLTNDRSLNFVAFDIDKADVSQHRCSLVYCSNFSGALLIYT